MRMNNAIVENLIDDGLNSAENIGKFSSGGDEELTNGHPDDDSSPNEPSQEELSSHGKFMISMYLPTD